MFVRNLFIRLRKETIVYICFINSSSYEKHQLPFGSDVVTKSLPLWTMPMINHGLVPVFRQSRLKRVVQHSRQLHGVSGRSVSFLERDVDVTDQTKIPDFHVGIDVERSSVLVAKVVQN